MNTQTQAPQMLYPLPGTLCWLRERPFQPAALMLVLATQTSTSAVVEVPVSAFEEGSEQGLEAALAQIQPKTIVAMKSCRLGPAIGRLTEQQYAGVRDSLRDWMSLAAA